MLLNIKQINKSNYISNINLHLSHALLLGLIKLTIIKIFLFIIDQMTMCNIKPGNIIYNISVVLQYYTELMFISEADITYSGEAAS